MNEFERGRLQAWLARSLKNPELRVFDVVPLAGGAIQENLLLRLTGVEDRSELVLRRDATATISASRTRRQEFALLRMAYHGGVCVPEPIAFCDDDAVLGSPFAVMEKMEGVAFGPKIVKDLTLAPDRKQLGRDLGRQLGLIHRLNPNGADLQFLAGDEPIHPVDSLVGSLRCSLDGMGIIRPELEWCIRWMETSLPRTANRRVCHNDFRTGNFMVDGDGLVAILDWEFAGIGDPMSDLGWFLAACWRFSRKDLEGGGVTTREAFYEGYQDTSDISVDDEAIRLWEGAAHVRWAVIALEQGHRHLTGTQRSLELALTGRMAAELERAALDFAVPSAWRAGHA
jgi:aminoglycoside phosphotransferase (APT) family kinase protein